VTIDVWDVPVFSNDSITIDSKRRRISTAILTMYMAFLVSSLFLFDAAKLQFFVENLSQKGSKDANFSKVRFKLALTIQDLAHTM